MKRKVKCLWLGLCGCSLLLLAGCQKDVNPDLISKKEICNKSEMSGLKKIVSSEAELIDLVKEIQSEFEELNANQNGRAADDNSAKTPEAAMEQIEDYVKSFVKSIEDSMEYFSQESLSKIENSDFETMGEILQLLQELKFKFNFDKSIDIGEIAFSDWIDVVCQSLETLVGELEESLQNAATDARVAYRSAAISRDAKDPEDEPDTEPEDDSEKGPEIDFDLDELFDFETILQDLPKTKDEIKQALVESFALEDLSGAEVVALLDKYCVIRKVALGIKINLDINLGKFLLNDKDYASQKMIDVAISGKLSWGIKNLNEIYAKMAADEDAVCPVKGFSVYMDESGKLALTANDVKSLIPALIGTVDESDLFSSLLSGTLPLHLTEAEFSGNQEISVAVCTKKGSGGYITVSVQENADVNNWVDMIQILSEMNKASEEEEEALFNELQECMSDAINIKISVADEKKEVWSKNYSIKTFVELMDSMFPAEE